MFYFSLTHQEISHQVAALINSHNQLSRKRSVSDIQTGNIDYVVETHGKWVLGAIGMDRQGYTFTEFKHLVVHPRWRGKGLAHLLLRRAISIATTKMIYATIREENESSLKLFEDLEFKKDSGYETDDHKVILVVRANPKWEKMKSGSKPHWLEEKQAKP